MDRRALDLKLQEHSACVGSASREMAEDQVRALAGLLWDEIRSQSLGTLRTLGNIVDSTTRMEGTRVILLASSGFLSGTLEFDQDQLAVLPQQFGVGAAHVVGVDGGWAYGQPGRETNGGD